MDEEYEPALKTLLGDSLEEKIAGKISEFGGLLTRRAAVRLLCKENGMSLERRLPLTDALKSRVPFSFSARVDRVFPLQEYPGSRDRSQRIHASDNGGEATIVLWNEQTAKSGGVASGDFIECSGAYARAGEIGVGKSGSIGIIRAQAASKIGSLKDGLCSVEGVVKEIFPVRTFKDKKTGGERQMQSFAICQSDSCARAVAWLPVSGLPPNLSFGDGVFLENAVFKNGEIHLNSLSRVDVRSFAAELRGRLDSISLQGAKLVFSLGGKELSCGIEEGLQMLGISSVPDGVLPETIADLKSSELSGKSFSYFCEGNRLIKLEPVG